MGFFKFLKKRGMSEEDMLDIPPIPPPEEQAGQGEDLGLDSFEGLPPPPVEFGHVADMPLPETEDLSAISKAPIAGYEAKPLMMQEPTIRVGKRLETPEISIAHEQYHFVKAGRYKEILDELVLSKSETRSAEERLLAVHQVYELEGKSLLKLKSVLEDLQKKLIVIDKMLLK